MDNFTAGQGDWRKRFFLIWTGQAFSIIGSMLVQFALVWYLTAKTGSALVLTTSTLMALLPQVFIGPFAGALVDRWNRKRVMILADGIIALFTLLLVLLFWSGQIQVWHIYVVSFIRALGGAFHFPAMSASTAQRLMASNSTSIRYSDWLAHNRFAPMTDPLVTRGRCAASIRANTRGKVSGSPMPSSRST